MAAALYLVALVAGPLGARILLEALGLEGKALDLASFASAAPWAWLVWRVSVALDQRATPRSRRPLRR